MKIPARDVAITMLCEAEKLNPGDWVQHSFFTAKAAEAIGNAHPRLNGEDAFVLGCLHDIGRRFGKAYMRHAYDGYDFLSEKGYDDAARICLTHTFWFKGTYDYPGERDCTFEEIEFINSYLSAIEYDEYDWLIQLCDCLSLPTGFCLLEKRLVDVALRYGTTKYTAEKWKLLFANKDRFEQEIGQSIYNLLSGVRENTFK